MRPSAFLFVATWSVAALMLIDLLQMTYRMRRHVGTPAGTKILSEVGRRQKILLVAGAVFLFFWVVVYGWEHVR